MASLRIYSMCISSAFLLSLLLCSMHLTTSFASFSPEETVPGGIVHLEASPPAPLAENSSLILAASRTHRHDPLDNFKRYGGGWNITNEHYWASVGFTGAPYFAIGGVWFIGFGLVLLMLLCYHCCCKRRVKLDELHEKTYTISLILLVFFTCGGIAGSILLYVGQDKFHRNISHTLDYVVDQSEFTVQSLRNVSGYLDLAKTTGVDQVFLPVSDQQNIDDLNRKLNRAANDLESRTKDISRTIRDVLENVYSDRFLQSCGEMDRGCRLRGFETVIQRLDIFPVNCGAQGAHAFA